MIIRVGGRRSKWLSSRFFQGYDQVRWALRQGAPNMLICQKTSKNERRCAVRDAIKSNLRERGVTNRKASLLSV